VTEIASSAWRRIRRLSGMSPREVYTRSLQAAGKRKDTLLYRLGMDPFPARRTGAAALAARGRFFCDPQDVPAIVDALRRRMPERAREIVAQAGRILERRFPLLGYPAIDLGPDIDWQRDPVHGKRAPLAPWPSVPFLKFDQVGDHKAIWELNRLQFLPALAKAYRITGDERFAGDLKNLWDDWRRENPYPLGINWTSTLEVAFRALSCAWAAFMLEGTPADSEEFQAGVSREIARAGWYIRRFLSTYFSPNTHLLGEGAALFLLGVRYPGLAGAGEWRETGWRIVCEEARNQVRADGLHCEQSIYYHVYALDFFLHARLIAERNGIAIPKHLDETIRAMASALAGLSQAGAPPRFGDDDGGRLFDPSRNRPEFLRDPLSTAAALFHDAGFKAAAPGLCEETLWLLGSAGEAAFDAVTAAATGPHSLALPASGIYAMGSPGPPPSQLFIDGGPHGWHSGGHGHADALSVQLAAGGRLWLTDPGTFVYVDPDSLREKFRGTPAHNTLTVDGRHQAEPAGPFSWGPHPRVEVLRWVAGEAFDLFEGRHSGYERLLEPVTHRRWALRWGERWWLVRDVAEGRGTHRFDIHWHFPPEMVLATCGRTVAVRRDGECLALVGAADDAWELALEESGYSPAYGVLVPAPVVRWSARAACPAEFASVIGFDPEMLDATLARVDCGADGAVAYEYAAAGDRRWCFFAAGERPWRSGDWASDAAMLCFRLGPAGVRELILAAGSYAEYAGGRVLEAPHPQPLVECRSDGLGWRIFGGGEFAFHPEALR
jgi:hypothetical protein